MTTGAGITYIYALTDPRSGHIRYVGKANDPQKRLRGHVASASGGGDRPRSSAWIKSLVNKNLYPKLLILEVVSKALWQSAERFWIALFKQRGEPLTNIAIGGRGPIGRIMPMEEREQRKDSAKKAWETRRELYGSGGVRDPEQRSQNVSLAMKGRIPWNKDKKETRPEVLARISAGSKGHIPWNKDQKEIRPEVLARLSKSHKGIENGWELRRKKYGSNGRR